MYDMSKGFIVRIPINDVQIDMKARYQQQEIKHAKLMVFKFATQFYVSILQKYIRTYINDDETCARWLISEFNNFEVLTECFLENTMPFMRQILAGLLYCAMLKVWDADRKKLNGYWEDIQTNV
jgi:hypothetical protein